VALLRTEERSVSISATALGQHQTTQAEDADEVFDLPWEDTWLTGPDNTHLKHAEVLADKLSTCQMVISGQLEMLESPRRDSSLYLPIFKRVIADSGKHTLVRQRLNQDKNKWMAATRPAHQEAKQTSTINATQHMFTAVGSSQHT